MSQSVIIEENIKRNLGVFNVPVFNCVGDDSFDKVRGNAAQKQDRIWAFRDDAPGNLDGQKKRLFGQTPVSYYSHPIVSSAASAWWRQNLAKEHGSSPVEPAAARLVMDAHPMHAAQWAGEPRRARQLQPPPPLLYGVVAAQASPTAPCLETEGLSRTTVAVATA
mmetsp:Transcript_21104/g.55555  ORF Transcript_21104/g.55555 Transcript_21104/m.55555 type:complete len:165 (+) Transcript_21104:68-562(+)